MSRAFTVTSKGGTMKLDGSEGARAKLAVRGTGMAPVAVQWFEGAGSGASFRGGRTLARTFDIPVKVYANRGDWANRDLVRQRFAKLGQILSLPNAPVRVTLDLDANNPTSNDKWWADMVKVGGGNFAWETDTDGRSYIKSVFSLQAGDPYWTSADQDGKEIVPVGVGIGILGTGISLAQLRLGSVDGFGSTTITNSGDVVGYPIWTVFAPFSGFMLANAEGRILEWNAARQGLPGDMKSSGSIIVNTQLGTVVDETGANMYKGLEPAPQFWPVNPGDNPTQVVMADASGSTRATVSWNIRREVLF
jgi:hypothetical protein